MHLDYYYFVAITRYLARALAQGKSQSAKSKRYVPLICSMGEIVVHRQQGWGEPPVLWESHCTSGDLVLHLSWGSERDRHNPNHMADVIYLILLKSLNKHGKVRGYLGGYLGLDVDLGIGEAGVYLYPAPLGNSQILVKSFHESYLCM